MNSTNAAGYVGGLNHSITSSPYKVERCDQVLLIKGKHMDLNDYCMKKDAFMTMSIYMLNLFEVQDSSKLVESIPMYQISTIPSPLQGALSCTQFQGTTKSFGFCYDTKEVLGQIIKAFKSFSNCMKGGPPDRDDKLKIILMLLEFCDISKIDFSEKGPFGTEGIIYKRMIDDHKAKYSNKKFEFFSPELKYDSKKINPYYSTTKAPGS